MGIPFTASQFLNGLSRWQVNVLPANTKLKPTHSGGNPGRSYVYEDPKHKPHDTWLDFTSYGFIPDNSQNNNNGPAQASYNLPPFKTTIGFYWGAVYFDTIGDDGNTFEYLPNGDYRILISLLKSGSDTTVVSDWETWLSPVIRLEGDWRNK